MAIVRIHKHTDNFSIIENTAAHDERLSWKAKGIHWYCLTQPDDWEIIQSELVKHASDGKSGLTSGIRELVMYGYWNIDSFQDEQGRFQTVYDVFESPKLNRRFQEERQKTGQQKRSIAIKSRKKSPLLKISNGEKKQGSMKENIGEITVAGNQQRVKSEEIEPLPKINNGEGKKAEMARDTNEDRKNTTPLPKIGNGEKLQNHRYRFSVTTKDYNNVDLTTTTRDQDLTRLDQENAVAVVVENPHQKKSYLDMRTLPSEIPVNGGKLDPAIFADKLSDIALHYNVNAIALEQFVYHQNIAKNENGLKELETVLQYSQSHKRQNASLLGFAKNLVFNGKATVNREQTQQTQTSWSPEAKARLQEVLSNGGMKT